MTIRDGRPAESIYMAKCKRRRTDGPTPCYCCPGECVGEPRDAADNERLCNEFTARMDAARDFTRRRNAARRRAVRRVIGRIICVIGLGLALVYAISHSRAPIDPRDPRCDTPARYEAMRDGADCS